MGIEHRTLPLRHPRPLGSRKSATSTRIEGEQQPARGTEPCSALDPALDPAHHHPLGLRESTAPARRPRSVARQASTPRSAVRQAPPATSTEAADTPPSASEESKIMDEDQSQPPPPDSHQDPSVLSTDPTVNRLTRIRRCLWKAICPRI